MIHDNSKLPYDILEKYPSPDIIMTSGARLSSYEILALLVGVFLYGCTVLKAVDRSFAYVSRLITRLTAARALSLICTLSAVSVLVSLIGGHEIVSQQKTIFFSVSNYSFQVQSEVVLSGIVSVFFLLVFSLFSPVVPVAPTKRKSSRESRPAIQ